MRYYLLVDATLEKRLHRAFEIGVIIKAIDGVLEVIGGIFFLVVSPSQLNDIMVWLTQRELSEDPYDLVAQLLLKLAAKFDVSTTQFAMGYLLSHGFVKIFIVINLLRKKIWAYPFSIFVLAVFTLYQCYRLTYDLVWWLIALTVFDVCIIWLVWHEYGMMKSRRTK